MPLKVDPQQLYFNKGKRAARQGRPRNSNPYSFKNDKAHWWDDGWMSYCKYTIDDVVKILKSANLSKLFAATEINIP